MPSKVQNLCLRNIKEGGRPSRRSHEGEAGRLEPGGRPRALDPRPSGPSAGAAGAGLSSQPPSSPDQAALGRGPLPHLPRRPGPVGGSWGVPFCGSPPNTNISSCRGIQRVNVLQMRCVRETLKRGSSWGPRTLGEAPPRPQLGSEGVRGRREGSWKGAEFPPPLPPRAETQAPQLRGSGCERPGGQAAGGGVGERAPLVDGRVLEGSKTRPLPDLARPRAGTRAPFGDLPSLLGRGSDPEGAGGGAGSARSRSRVAAFFPGGGGSLHVAPPPGRARRNERGRCTPTRVAKGSEALLFLKAPLQLQRGEGMHSCKRKDFCVSTEVSRNHYFFSRWLHTRLSRFLLICCSPGCRARS